MIHSNVDRDVFVDIMGAYRSLGAAVVLQAVSDWEHLCRMCASGKPFYYFDCNFPELERFFKEDADYIGGISIRKIMPVLYAKKDAAMLQRQKLIESGKVQDFGTWLAQARRNKKINRTVFAERTGIPYKVIAQIETGEYIPTKKVRDKIIKQLCRW